MDGGRYIALEGPEGCGKSTQARVLATDLGALLTRETGGTSIGLRLREILHDTNVGALSARAEALIAAADRAQHLDEIVLPTLRAGHDVVSDRSVYSTMAYQGYGRGLDLDVLRAVNEWATTGCWPDLVVLIDVEPAELARRLDGRDLDRFERAGAEFHERVRHGYRQLAVAEPRRWVIVDGGGPLETVAAAVRAAVRERFGR